MVGNSWCCCDCDTDRSSRHHHFDNDETEVLVIPDLEENAKEENIARGKACPPFLEGYYALISWLKLRDCRYGCGIIAGERR